MNYPKPNEQAKGYSIIDVRLTSWEIADMIHVLDDAIKNKRVVTSDSRGNILTAIESLEKALKDVENHK